MTTDTSTPTMLKYSEEERQEMLAAPRPESTTGYAIKVKQIAPNEYTFTGWIAR